MKKLCILASLLLTATISFAQQPAAASKLSPALQALITDNRAEGGALRAPAAGTQTVDVLTKLADGADQQTVLADYDARLLRTIGRVLIVSVPVQNVEAMAADERVLRVEAERAPRPLTDIVPGQTGADKVHANTGNNLPQAYDGKGVVVGIVDSGFDFINPSFRNASGTTRIQWATDYMTLKTYNNPAEVTAAMHSSDAATITHGTHVASIAAGSRVNDINDVFYSGMAPQADIAIGAVNSEITSNGLSSTQALMAFEDIFNYAEAMEKPCVINYSMGDAQSFSDSRQLEEEAIRNLLKKPGRAIVVASGNAGGTSRYAHKTADTAEGGAGVCFNDYEQYGTSFGIELKVRPQQAITLKYTNSNYATTKGTLTKTAQELEGGATMLLGTKSLKATLRGQTADGYDVIYITTSSMNTTFTTSERILVTIGGEGEAWIYADPLCAQLESVNSIAGHQLAEDGYSVAWPACMDEVITVGNIAHRLQIITMANKYASQGGVATPTDLTEYESTKGEGYLARSSSTGPTLKGAMKPDVCAPGVNVVAAQSFFIDDDTYYSLAAWDMAALDTEYESWGGMSGYFHMMAQTGTSMSAPAVTGIIALWMQADPTLTTARIKEIIANSSRQPDSELTYPNNQYGHGEIDAYRGLLYMLGLTGIRGISQNQPSKAVFALDGRLLRITFGEDTPQATVRIFSTDGRQLMQTNETTVNLATLPAGVYAVQVTTGSKATTGSTLIRL